MPEYESNVRCESITCFETLPYLLHWESEKLISNSDAVTMIKYICVSMSASIDTGD
jgi:hypothetical protein